MPNPGKKSKAPDLEKYAENGSEDMHAIALMSWAQKNLGNYPELIWLAHIPNGGLRTKAQAGKLRAMGVKKGVPDYLLAVQRGNWQALWIELKLPAQDGKRETHTSPDQDKWIAQLKKQGMAVMVCHGWLEARDILVKYLSWGEDKKE